MLHLIHLPENHNIRILQIQGIDNPNTNTHMSQGKVKHYRHRSFRRGVPGTLRGVAPIPNGSPVSRRSPAKPPPSCTRCTSRTARRAASPTLAGGRSISTRDSARKRSCWSSGGCWLEPLWIGKCDEREEICDEGGRERDRVESASDSRENR